MRKLVIALGIALSLSTASFGDALTVALPDKTVTTGGTRVALSSSTLKVAAVVIKAKSDNTGNIYVGGSTVAAATGVALAAGESITLSAVVVGSRQELVDLANVYIDADTNGDGVTASYQKVSN